MKRDTCVKGSGICVLGKESVKDSALNDNIRLTIGLHVVVGYF